MDVHDWYDGEQKTIAETNLKDFDAFTEMIRKMSVEAHPYYYKAILEAILNPYKEDHSIHQMIYDCVTNLNETIQLKQVVYIDKGKDIVSIDFDSYVEPDCDGHCQMEGD